ncbi:MAG: hypothetical protein RLW61_11005 [Gammaproteobacteria bacterium]
MEHRFIPRPLATIIAAAALCWTGTAPAAVAAATPGVAATVEAHYQGLSSGPTSASAGNPGSVAPEAVAGPGGGSSVLSLQQPGQPEVLVYDEAIARARANLPGTIGSYSHAGGYTPSFDPPSAVTATAQARTLTQWVVTSSDPNVTSVGIDVLAFFDGTLLTYDAAGVAPGDLTASITAAMRADTLSGQLYGFEAEATLDSELGLSASANWSGDFLSGSSGFGSVRQSTVDYDAFFDDAFVVNVGETFSWEVVLDTAAYAAGPFELWAVADFYNTAGFELSVDTPGVTLSQVVVPVPPALPLLAGATGLLALRRRRAA